MSTATERTAALDLLLSRAEWVKTYPAKRRCRHKGCATVLSVYNPSEFCAAHEPEPDWHYNGHDFGLCERCGLVHEARNFSRRRAGRDTVCRSCRLADEVKDGFGRVQCKRCGQFKPATSQFWSMIQRGRDPKPRPHGWCRECRNEQRRERDKRLRESK